MLKYCWFIAVAGLLLCGFFGIAKASGADEFDDSPYVVKSWGTEDGLPQSSVISVCQGQDGYLWMGTLNGLVRFDGLHFTVFDEANTPGLNSSRIVSVFADSHGNLWVGTESDGIALIRNDGKVTSFDLGKNRPGGRVASICEDANGAIWFNTVDGELARYWNVSNSVMVLNVRCRPVIAEKSGPILLAAGTNLVSIVATPDTKAIVVQQMIAVQDLDFLLASRNGGYWRFADGRIQKWRGGQMERDLGAYPWKNDQSVSCACEDLDGNLVVGTQGGGVFWFDAQGRPTQIAGAEGLSHNTVLSVCMDREGDLWVGTDGGGLDRIKPKQFRVMQGSLGRTIQSVCADGGDGLWFATFGGPLSHWTNGTLLQYSAAGLQDRDLYVRSVYEDQRQEVWAGAAFGGLFLFNGKLFRSVPQVGIAVSAIYQDRAGTLWVGSQQGLASLHGDQWKTYTTQDGLTSASVRALAADADGNLWIGTEHGGLNRFHDGKFSAIRKSAEGLPSDNVSALWPDADGVLWIGTSAGLARFQNGKWTRYTTREGLASNGIGYIVDDGLGSLWLGSYAGLMRIPKISLNDFAAGETNSVQCRVYGESDGLPTRECVQGSQPAACQTRDGRLWFGTIRGLVSVNPADLKPNPFHPPVIIESVVVPGGEQSTNAFFAGDLKPVAIPPGRELLEIHYTSLNLGAADRSRFRYRLEGHETAWTEADGSRVARYSNLPPGSYRFEVTACNEDGVWSESPATVAITVLPPFWRTGWFISLMAIVSLGMIVGIVYVVSTQKLQRQLAILKQQEALEKERGRIARDLHDQLGANLMQMSLLGEMAQSDKDLPEEVESHAQQITQTAQETTKALDEIVWAVNPSNDTVDGLITYVCKYAQEYFAMAGLRYRLDVPTQLPETPLPPEVRHNAFLAAKEAINNVVKHAQATAAWLRLRLEPHQFTLEIEDDGRGLAGMDEKTGRNGLRNMRKRMEDIGGGFSIAPGAERGAVVRLTVPVQNHGI